MSETRTLDYLLDELLHARSMLDRGDTTQDWGHEITTFRCAIHELLA